MVETSSAAEFDKVAGSYDNALNQGLSISGEGKEYFAERRVSWLAQRLREAGVRARVVMDYGCGTGTATPYLRDILGAEEVIGVDVSEESLKEAEGEHGCSRVRFARIDDSNTFNHRCDLVYCNGVFHHIVPAERPSAIEYVRRSLRPGGLFALWENNPWNPGTRLVMRRIPFDRDAITLSPPECRRLVQSGGFEVLRNDFLFIFPRFLSPLRAIEPSFAKWPIGAQYLVLAQRSGCSSESESAPHIQRTV